LWLEFIRYFKVFKAHTYDLVLPLLSFFAEINQLHTVVFLDIMQREFLPVDQTVEVAVDAVAVCAHECEEFGHG
jgi:hypothetical protein